MATRISPPQNKTYYINPAYLTFVENSGYGANLIQVSASSSCHISVYDPANGIGYSDADRNYRRWKVTAYNNKFPDDRPEHRGKWFIYVRLERSGTSSLVVYDQVERGVNGGAMADGVDENGNQVKVEGEPDPSYFFVMIGEVGGTDGSSIRQITYDTGYLTSNEAQNDKDGMNEMWELVKDGFQSFIKARHWLTSFSVKGFIRLVGSFIFTGKSGEEKPITDIKRSTDTDVPVDDTTIPTTGYVRSISDDRYLKKYEEDETNYRIRFHDGIEAGHYVKGMIGGDGTLLDGQGYGEMNGLTLREFLEVPELRFNRIDVVSGELWNSIAFGLVESVDTEKRICTVKLEGNERCGLHVYDICRGIFADFGDGTQWEGVDECGFQHLYGFRTVYFTPTRILEDGDGVFRFQYDLKAGTVQHPCQSMKFAVYGNFVDSLRQASAYSTRTYKRYLNKVDTWVINPDKHIYAQYGDLEGLSVGGMHMHGYGSYQSNSYFTGVQIQFTPEQKAELQGESAYSAVLSDYEGVVTIDDEGNVVGGETGLLNVVSDGMNVVSDGMNVVTSYYKLRTQVQAMRGSTPLFYSPSSPSEGSYMLAVSTVGCTASVINGVVAVTSVSDTERCYADILVNCEGKASFSLRYTVNAVRDGRNPVIADLDNEMDSVACDAKGKVLFGLPVGCTVSMWSGIKTLSLDRLEAEAPEGVTATADKDTGAVRITAVSDEAERVLPVRITAYATHGDSQYRKELVFTVNKVVAGENALLYKLSPSVSSVKVDDEGGMTVSAVSCLVVASDGNRIQTLASLPDGVTMEYFLDKEDAKSYQYDTPVELTDANRTVTFRLYSGSSLIDVETVPVLLDGSSPVSLDLDNEMFSVATDASGKVTLMPEMVARATMYWGSKALETEVTEVEAPDGTEVSFSGDAVTVTAVSQGEGTPDVIRVAVKAEAMHGQTNYVRTAHLVINKVRQGDSAWVLDLLPSASVVKVDNKGSYTPVSVSCRTRMTTGKEVSVPSALQDRYTMRYSLDGGSEKSYSYGEEIAVSLESDKEASGVVTAVTFLLYHSADGGLEKPWILVDKETVPVLRDAADAFKSTVFRRTNSTPDTPQGGSYDSPVPEDTSWSDGIPDGEEILWASTRTFTSDGQPPQDEGWSTPAQMTDTASFDVEYSSVESNPGTPESNPSNWSGTASSSTVWMATRSMRNGVWTAWQVTRIKGEKGDTGAQGSKGDKGDNGNDGADSHHYSISPASFTIGVNSTGSLEPSSMTFTCYDDTGTSNRETETAQWYVYGSNTGTDSSYVQIASYTSYTASYSASFSTSYKYYRVKARPYSSIECIAEGTVVRDGSNEAAGSMPYNCGEYSSSTRYYYNADRRDIVTYSGGVYMVRSFDADGYVYDKLPTNTTYWVPASKDIFRAMDTALIDGANIAGFLFKDELLQSQDGALSLNGDNGEIVAGTTYQLKINPNVEGYPALRWVYGTSTLASLSLNTPTGGYVSGNLTLKDIAGRTAIVSPSYTQVSGSSYSVELNASLSNEAKISISKSGISGGQSATFGMDYSGRIRIGSTSWPTSSSYVGVGEVYLDGNTLKVRSS